MGIIIKQSVRGAFWSYLGIGIGYINVGIIMPQFFDTAQVGLVQIFISLSLILSQFSTLGFTSVINRMFPVFRNPARQHHGFLFLALVTALIGFTLSAAGFYLLKPWIVESNIQKSPLLVDYLYLLLPLVLMRLLFTLLDNYNKVLYDAVTGTFWLEFMHKVINLVLIVLFAFGWIDFRSFFVGYVLSMSMPVVPLIVVLIRRQQFNLRPDRAFLSAPLRRNLSGVMLFGFVNGLAGILLVNIDKLFVNQYLSLNEVGIFGVCALFATLIKVPFNSISKISTGIIAESWKSNDINNIRDIYQKSALHQAIFGTLIFTGLLVNLHNIFRILPPVYSSGKWVIIIYSAGMLLITILGMASVITETSRHFRFSTLFLFLAILAQLLLGVWLVPRYGITGAAIATISTLLLNAILQVLLQQIAFKISGLSIRLLWVVGFGVVVYLAGNLLPEMPLIADVIVRSGIVTLLYGLMVYFSGISPETNRLIYSGLQRVKLISNR